MTRIGSSDLEVSGLNLGGNVFGWTADRQASFAILDAYREGGGNFIDTADSYSAWVPGHAGGESETMIGEWLAGDPARRDEVVIATKVSRRPARQGLRPDNVRAAVDDSLARLRTDRIDLYYAHFDDTEVPIAEVAGVFSELVDAGKIRHSAISNLAPERIDGWMAVVEADGLHAPVALQPHYNLIERDFETNGLCDAAERHGLGVLPYYALASGFLTGKYRPGATPADSPRAGGMAKYLDNPDAVAALEALSEIAAARGESVTTVALAWLRQQPTVVAPIASASRPEQLPDLLASMTLELSASELAALA
ncbi:aldo/keto reductase [Nocardioides sp. Kera G14]|uniref:aldo/keto reductase n=1 Tax=Nocardioides sp. Kera G14 TaxID=2884264 RepID=UPI001D1078EE|nr:aldo/keto reductase [Nocardioides sp. Kera G14]UDY23829.1 aldo/keto reductase [Nocardioides sp. Kera G14]